MSTTQCLFWLILALAGVVGSGLCAGLETGIYRLNRIRLHLLDHRGHPAAKTLTALLADRSALLASLLIGANVFSYLASSAASVLVESRFPSPWQAIAVVALVLTPVLFVVADVLPKDLFAAYADLLVYPFAGALRALRWGLTCTGLLPLTVLAGEQTLRLLGAPRSVPAFHPRHHVSDLLKEGVGYGLVSDEQSALVERVLALAGRRVADEMVPWRRVATVRIDQAPASLWTLAQDTPFSRFPVLDPAGQLLGVISLYDALAHEPAACPPIAQLMQPVIRLDIDTPSRLALTQLRQSPVALAVVLDRGKPAGVVTVKDLVEPITGELANW